MSRKPNVNATEEDFRDALGKPVRCRTRSVKVAENIAPTPKPSEVKRVQSKVNQFKPTLSQQEFLDKVDKNVVTFVSAVAGSGKTSASLWWFCKEYLRDPSLNIVITRTPAEVGKDRIGFLPNSVNDKCYPHLASTQRIIEEFIGKEKFAADFDKRIRFVIPNFILGSTMDNTLWLIDEAQLMQPIIMRLLLERIGKNTKVIVSGSSAQIYTGDKDRNGMEDAMSRFFDKEDNPLYDNFALHRFTVDDVMRSEVVKDVLRAYGEV